MRNKSKTLKRKGEKKRQKEWVPIFFTTVVNVFIYLWLLSLPPPYSTLSKQQTHKSQVHFFSTFIKESIKVLQLPTGTKPF